MDGLSIRYTTRDIYIYIKKVVVTIIKVILIRRITSVKKNKDELLPIGWMKMLCHLPLAIGSYYRDFPFVKEFRGLHIRIKFCI